MSRRLHRGCLAILGVAVDAHTVDDKLRGRSPSQLRKWTVVAGIEDCAKAACAFVGRPCVDLHPLLDRAERIARNLANPSAGYWQIYAEQSGPGAVVTLLLGDGGQPVDGHRPRPVKVRLQSTQSGLPQLPLEHPGADPGGIQIQVAEGGWAVSLRVGGVNGQRQAVGHDMLALLAFCRWLSGLRTVRACGTEAATHPVQNAEQWMMIQKAELVVAYDPVTGQGAWFRRVRQHSAAQAPGGCGAAESGNRERETHQAPHDRRQTRTGQSQQQESDALSTVSAVNGADHARPNGTHFPRADGVGRYGSDGTGIATCYVCRRKHRSAPGQTEVADELWLVVQVGPVQSADAVPKWVLDPALDSARTKDPARPVKEALAESMANHIVEMAWKIDDGQVADRIASLPDRVEALVQQQLAGLAQEAGVAPPEASFGADVTATLVLSPALKPVEKGLHTLEVIGIVFGLVTGLHPLAILCAKHLAHDELGSMVATVIKQAIQSPAAQALDDERSLSLRTGAETRSEPTSSRTPAAGAVADHAAVQPQTTTLPTVRSFGDQPSADMTDYGLSGDVSPEALRTLRQLAEALQAVLDAPSNPAASATASVDAIEEPRAVRGLSALE